MPENDGKLAILAQKGDTKAEERLIEKYRFLVKNKAKIYYITGADKEDVIQEGMIGLFKAIKSYNESKSSFATYVGVCVNGQLINAIKKANRLKNKILNESISLDAAQGEKVKKEFLEDIFASEDTPEKMVLAQELMEYANSENNSLFSEFEKKVWLYVQEGLNEKQIARELDKEIKSVENAIQRIKKKLYSLLWE